MNDLALAAAEPNATDRLAAARRQLDAARRRGPSEREILLELAVALLVTRRELNAQTDLAEQLLDAIGPACGALPTGNLAARRLHEAGDALTRWQLQNRRDEHEHDRARALRLVRELGVVLPSL